jgi:putative FmdB family regulatory protein
MPIYEYRCEEGHTFEVMQRMSDDPVVTCQTCSARVHRVFHPVAVHFKGSGFYNTDYGTRKRQREQKESGEGGKEGGKDSKTTSESKSSEGSGKSSESKSETKSESKSSTASKSD